MMKLSDIEKTQATADGWIDKESWAWASRIYAQVVVGLLALGVRRRTPEEGVAFMVGAQIDGRLERCAESHKQLVAQIEAGGLPASVLGGNYVPFVLAHLATLLDHSSTRFWIEVGNSEAAKETSTVFWTAYGKMLAAAIAREPTAVPEIKLRGAENYWHPYLALMAAVSSDADVNEPRERAKEVFLARNNDKRFKEDAYEIEGSGRNPVAWDFRLAAIERLATK